MDILPWLSRNNECFFRKILAYTYLWNNVKTFERADHKLDVNEHWNIRYEGWNFNSGNYLFTTDTK